MCDKIASQQYNIDLNGIHLSRSEQERDLSWDRFEKKYQPKKRLRKDLQRVYTNTSKRAGTTQDTISG